MHKIVEGLPEGELNAAWRFLTYLRDLGCDPVLRAFSEAREDDEPLTPEDEAAMREGEEQLNDAAVRYPNIHRWLHPWIDQQRKRMTRGYALLASEMYDDEHAPKRAFRKPQGPSAKRWVRSAMDARYR